MAISLPSNVHVSKHPCLRAKLSQLRSENTNARETKLLIHEIAVIVACEALAENLDAVPNGAVCTPPPPGVLAIGNLFQHLTMEIYSRLGPFASRVRIRRRHHLPLPHMPCPHSAIWARHD